MAEQSAKVALGLTSLNPTDTLSLNSKIVGSMTKNQLFPEPKVALSDLEGRGKAYAEEETAISQDEAKLKARRTANKGKLDELKKLMGVQGNYVDGIAQGSRAIIESAGMPATAEPSPVGKLPTISGLRLSPGGAKGQVQARWDAVGQRSGGKGYMVHSGPSPDNMTHKEYAPTASCTLTGLPSGHDAWVCVQALGADSGDCCQPQMQMVP
jgi:hypothetical protein